MSKVASEMHVSKEAAEEEKHLLYEEENAHEYHTRPGLSRDIAYAVLGALVVLVIGFLAGAQAGNYFRFTKSDRDGDGFPRKLAMCR